MDVIQRLDRAEIEKLEKKKIDDFRPGDTVKVSCNVVEGDKRRIQVFEGVVIFRKGSGLSESVCVRKVSAGGIGVERVFPLYSPTVDKIVRVREGKVRRARLYYLRDRAGKSARVREKSAVAKVREASGEAAAPAEDTQS